MRLLNKFFSICFIALSLSSRAEIIIAGNKSVSADKIKILVDCIFDLDEIKRVLYESDLFEDVSVKKIGDDIIINLQEKKLIGKIFYYVNGDKKQKEDFGPTYDSLQKITDFKIGFPIDEQKILLAKTKIELYYLQQGYRYACVSHKLVQENETYQLHIDVVHGDKLEINPIKILGLKKLHPDILRSEITPRVKNYLLFFTVSPEPYMIQNDLNKILDAAHNEGFLALKIKTAYIENDATEQNITIAVNEGEQYHFRNITLNLDSDIIEQNFPEKLTGIAYEYKIKEYIQKMHAYYKKHGQLIDITYDKTLDNGYADITFHAKTHVKKFVASKVIIKGNSRTRNDLISQIIKFAPGDYFDYTTLHRIETLLTESGFFKNVNATAYIDPSDAQKRQIVVISVEEASVGEIGLMGSLMYENSLEASLNVFYGYPNFFGKGHHIMFSINVGTNEDSFNLAYKVPSIFHKDISWSNNFSLSTSSSGASKNTDRNQGANNVPVMKDVDYSGSYKMFSACVGTGFGFDLFKYGFLKISNSIEWQDISAGSFTNSANISRFFKKDMLPEERWLNTFEITHKIGKTFNRRQNFVLTNSAAFSVDQHTGNIKYTPSLSYTYPITRSQEVYLKSTVSYGYIAKLREKHYWMDNFSSGQVYVKGVTSMGPMENMRYTELGGTQKFNAYAEVTMPFIFPKEWNVSAFAGVYCGALWGNPYDKHAMLDQYAVFRRLPQGTHDIVSDEFLLRVSASMGLRWNLGPFKLELSFNTIMRHAKDDALKTWSVQLKV